MKALKQTSGSASLSYTPIAQLQIDRVELVAQLRAVLSDISDLRGLILHGSHTRGHAVEDSDIDIISIYKDQKRAAIAAQALAPAVQEHFQILASSYTERFSWFGRLWTFYFQNFPSFSVDVGIITIRELRSWFFVEPNAIILFDPDSFVARRKAYCREIALAARERRREGIVFESYHVARKLGRSLRRQHLWDAFEYINIIRRLLFESFRLDCDQVGYEHVGRQERDIESALPSISSLLDWQATIPEYDRRSILDAAVKLLLELADIMEAKEDVDSQYLLTLAVAELKDLRESLGGAC